MAELMIVTGCILTMLITVPAMFIYIIAHRNKGRD